MKINKTTCSNEHLNQSNGLVSETLQGLSKDTRHFLLKSPIQNDESKFRLGRSSPSIDTTSGHSPRLQRRLHNSVRSSRSPRREVRKKTLQEIACEQKLGNNDENMTHALSAPSLLEYSSGNENYGQYNTSNRKQTPSNRVDNQTNLISNVDLLGQIEFVGNKPELDEDPFLEISQRHERAQNAK